MTVRGINPVSLGRSMSLGRASAHEAGSGRLSDRPYRIAYVINALEPGGLERCVAHFANRLDRPEFQPLVICLSHCGEAAGWIQAEDVPVVELHKRPGNDLAVIGRLARALREYRVDLVHSHNWGTLFETTLARRRAGVPCHVHAEHGQELAALQASGWKQALRGWVTRWSLDRADSVVVCAESVRKRVCARSGFPESEMVFLANGVEVPGGDEREAAAIRRRLGVRDEETVLGSVSRLAPVKDFGTAIDAVSLLISRGFRLHLVLVGDGPERASLEARARTAGIADWVHLVGWQNNVGDWLRAFDIYVNSSLSEAMSMGILESMAVGVPVVATEVGDAACLLGGSPACGRLVAAASPALLAAALGGLANAPSQRRDLARVGMERHREHYSISGMVARYAQLYRRVLRARLPNGRGVQGRTRGAADRQAL